MDRPASAIDLVGPIRERWWGPSEDRLELARLLLHHVGAPAQETVVVLGLAAAILQRVGLGILRHRAAVERIGAEWPYARQDLADPREVRVARGQLGEDRIEGRDVGGVVRVITGRAADQDVVAISGERVAAG